MRAPLVALLLLTGAVVAFAPAADAQRTLQRPRNAGTGGPGGGPPLGGPGASNASGATGGTGGANAGHTGNTGNTGNAGNTGNGGNAGNGGAGAGGTGTATGPGGKAQGDTSGLPQFEQGVEYTPRSPNYKVSLSLEDADLAELVRVIGQLTGKRFIFGGKVRNIKASIYAPQKVTVAEAYQAFLSILETNGLTVVPHGRFLKIVETGGIATQATPTYGTDQAAPAEDRYVTRMLRLQHAPADEVGNILGHFKSKDGDITVASGGNLLIITDTGSNIRRMMQIVEEVDVGAAGDQMWIEPIHYASASDIAARINELFELKGSGGKGEKGGGGGGFGALHVTKVIADDRSNSVIIVATEPAYMRILEFIKRLDVPQTGEGEIHVLPLQHADAVELTKTLKELVQGEAGQGGRGAAKGGSPAAETQVFEGPIKLSADKATNSIVVTSSLRDFASLRTVVDRLDQPRRQVFIEAVIMDLSVTRSTQLGVNFHAGGLSDLGLGGGQSLLFGGLNPLETIAPLGSDPSLLQGLALGLRGPGIPGTESFSVTGQTIPAFGVILQALTTAGDTDVLSTPHILATDNIKAEINVGQNIPLQTNIGGLPPTSTSGAGGATSGFGFGFGFGASPARQDVGTKITITPHLNDSNEVRLELQEEISEAGDAIGQLGVVPITKRTATTQLVVKDQETVVIGGLMRNRIAHQETKIPVLGDIPLLGVLFRQTTNTVEKLNLLLVLTPYIIRDQSDLRTIFERKMQERQEFLDRYFVFSEDHDYKPPKDYSRTNGLLEDIKASYRAIDEKQRLEEILRPKDVIGHQPTQPLDLPEQLRSNTTADVGAGAAQPAPTETRPRQPANITVSPPVRRVERIER